MFRSGLALLSCTNSCDIQPDLAQSNDIRSDNTIVYVHIGGFEVMSRALLQTID